MIKVTFQFEGKSPNTIEFSTITRKIHSEDLYLYGNVRRMTLDFLMKLTTSKPVKIDDVFYKLTGWNLVTNQGFFEITAKRYHAAYQLMLF
jgi:hypothetical protein